MGARGPASYALTLFVRGHSARSAETIRSVCAALDDRVSGRYSLRVVDVHQQPSEARKLDVVATPTLIRVSPGPSLRSVGLVAQDAAMSRLKLV